MVYTERTKTAAVSHDTSHVTVKQHYLYTTSVDIKITCYKRIPSFIQNHMQHRAVSLLENRGQCSLKQSVLLLMA